MPVYFFYTKVETDQKLKSRGSLRLFYSSLDVEPQFVLFESSWKIMKMTPILCACAVVITLEMYKCLKRAPRSVKFNFFIKARRWWPLSRSSTKIFFWRLVFLWVNLALLNPIERFSWRVCVVQATKKEEESCSFLDAIGRRSCGPLSRLTKNRQVGKPKLRLKRIETAGRYATVRFDTLLWRDMHFNSRSSLSCLSSACMSLGMLLKAKFTPAVSSVQSLTLLPPPSLSLCPSLRVTRFEKKNHFRWTRQSEHPSESSINVATRSRSPTASMQWLIQKKSRAFQSCNIKLCFVNFERPQTRSRLGQLHAEWCNFCSLRVTFWM